VRAVIAALWSEAAMVPPHRSSRWPKAAGGVGTAATGGIGGAICIGTAASRINLDLGPNGGSGLDLGVMTRQEISEEVQSCPSIDGVVGP